MEVPSEKFDSLPAVAPGSEGDATYAACWHCGTPLVSLYCPSCDVSWIYDPVKVKGLKNGTTRQP